MESWALGTVWRASGGMTGTVRAGRQMLRPGIHSNISSKMCQFLKSGTTGINMGHVSILKLAKLKLSQKHFAFPLQSRYSSGEPYLPSAGSQDSFNQWQVTNG